MNAAKTVTATFTLIPSGGTIVSGETYQIIARHSDKTLEVANCGTTNGTPIQQGTWTGLACQQFIVTDLGDGSWRITPTHQLNRAFRFTAATEGAKVEMRSYSDVDDRKWILVDLGNGYYQIKAKGTDLCINIENSSTADGALATIRTSNSSALNQQFSFVNVGALKSAYGYDLGTEGEDTSGATVVTYPNPVSTILNIDLGSKLADASIQLFDNTGRLVMTDKAQGLESTLDLSGLAKGLYILQIQATDGTVISKKIIKQ